MQGEADREPQAAETASPAALSEVEVLAALCGNRRDRRKAAAPVPEPEVRCLALL